MEGLPKEIFIENIAVNAEFLNNVTGEITAGAYLMSITENVSDCQQIGTRALLIINNYILVCFFLGGGTNAFFYLAPILKMKLEECQPQAVLLKFNLLQLFENHIKSVYYSNYPMTLYFKAQFLKLKCTENAKSTIKNVLKSETKSFIITEKYQGPEKKA